MQDTPFYSSHLASNAKMINFYDWHLPLHYGSQIKEHEAVRNQAGMFDVSHMPITDVSGPEATLFLRYLLSNDVIKLQAKGVGHAFYSTMLNHQAGIVDDLIVYLMPFGYRLVTNAATYAKDMNWLKEVGAKFKLTLTNRKDLAMLAVQGPHARAKVSAIKQALAKQLTSLKPFSALLINEWCYAKTGYTGEDGLEIMLPQEQAPSLWQQLINQGVIPCGLGARDTLRLEAGMNLYGQDMDETINPLECNLHRVVDLLDNSRDFIGKQAYLNLKAKEPTVKQVGLILEGKGILRAGQLVIKDGLVIGNVTSGTFSPSLKLSIAMARIATKVKEPVSVDIRGNLHEVKIVSLPFI